MQERRATLILEPETSDHCRRFRHTQLVGDVIESIDLDDHLYLLIEDRHGSILGVVEVQEILERIGSPDPVERRRWLEMPLEAAISARLDSYSKNRRRSNSSSSSHQTELDGFDVSDASRQILATTLSTEDDDLAAIFLNDDLYLRWSSVKEILQHALVDPVTQLPNRMVFERRLREEWQRLERTRASVCVILIDLDYFKSINDQFGHAVGDIVLDRLGKTLQRQVRSYDLIARYGGDEFAALLTGCTAQQLAIPIHRLQAGLKGLTFPSYPDLPPLTLSVGAVTIHSQQDVHCIDDLIREADTCLYEAKRDGRNCAYIADLTNHDRRPKRVEVAHDSTAANL